MSDESQASRSAPRRWAIAVASTLTGVLLFAAGFAGGYVGASQRATPADARGHGGGDAHADHAHAPPISKRTLANLGVVVGELRLQEFVRTRDVPAVVAASPGALTHAVSPLSGVVEDVSVVAGETVKAGAAVARVRRDPFPRPTLALTDPVLRPLNEEFHQAVSGLRSTADSLAIARGELERLRAALASAQGTVRTRTEVELENEVRRAERARENARHEAERHGLLPAEIEAIEKGGTYESDLPPVRRVLARNGLWSEEAEAVLASLPADVREHPYPIAVVAELAGSQALTRGTLEAILSRPALAAAFLDVAGLIQQGTTPESLVAMADAGWLEAIVVVRAPKGAADWDAVAVDARPGDRVEGGARLVEFRDGAAVRLEASLAGPDVAAVSAALVAGEGVAAEPLVPGAGPSLSGLRILAIEPAASGSAGGRAVIRVENRVAAETKFGSRVFRTWALRTPTRYVVRVPAERTKDVFVLDADGLATQGPDSVVVLEDGAGFRPVPVRVIHRDARTAVVANDGAVFPGDRAVVRGAYAAMLAVQAAAGGGADPHAGHHH